jgi:oxygen-independent coproporphyrinogen-3 oxidase
VTGPDEVPTVKPGVDEAQPLDAELVARYDRRVPRYTSYPTAPNFTPDVDAAAYAAWLGALPRGEALSLYLHVPFCAELCFYCGCHTTVARRYAPVAAYVDLIEREIALVAGLLGKSRPVAHVHWGGGTPTILSPEHFIQINRILRLRFDVGRDAEIAIEIDPRVLTPIHVEALAAAGVNRASLGVQDFDETVQRAINRIQTYQETASAVERLRGAGIRSVSLDLMYGLPHQSVASVETSVRTALQLNPDRIALFGYAHVPWMKRHQALLPEDRLPEAVERIRQASAASAAIVEAGYVAIGLDHFARPDDPLAHSQRTGHLRRNFQGYTTDKAPTLIGFGTSSIGHLPQGYVQNASSTVAYRDAILSGRLATARGIAVTADDRLRGAIIERLMCDLEVDLERIASIYGGAPSCRSLLASMRWPKTASPAATDTGSPCRRRPGRS